MGWGASSPRTSICTPRGCATSAAVSRLRMSRPDLPALRPKAGIRHWPTTVKLVPKSRIFAYCLSVNKHAVGGDTYGHRAPTTGSPGARARIKTRPPRSALPYSGRTGIPAPQAKGTIFDRRRSWKRAQRGGYQAPPVVRRAADTDIPSVIALDNRVTGLAKPEYWQDVFERYGKQRLEERFFLVAETAQAESGAPILGFIIGEVRAWEFGSAPCGWVVACGRAAYASAWYRAGIVRGAVGRVQEGGVSKMRTMVARDDRLHLLFFRSEGMMAGLYPAREGPRLTRQPAAPCAAGYRRPDGLKLYEAADLQPAGHLCPAGPGRAPDHQLSVAQIGEKYGVSSHHLAKVMHVMSRAGLVRAVRGAGGGYQFGGNPRRTTLLDVIELFENLGSDNSPAGGSPTAEERALSEDLDEIDDIVRADSRVHNDRHHAQDRRPSPQ